MKYFVLFILILLAVLVLWIIRSRRPAKSAGVADTRIYAVHTQTRTIQPLDHSTGREFGLLLKAARGDRSVVEKWIILAQKHTMPPLSREDAIAKLAQQLQASRRQ